MSASGRDPASLRTAKELKSSSKQPIPLSQKLVPASGRDVASSKRTVTEAEKEAPPRKSKTSMYLKILLIVTIVILLGMGGFALYLGLSFSKLQSQLTDLRDWTAENFRLIKQEHDSILGDYSPIRPHEPSKNYRLLNITMPEKYFLSLKVNLPGYGVKFPESEKYKTYGTLRIAVMVLQETDFIEMHMKQLAIRSAKLNGVEIRGEVPLVFAIDEKLEKVAFTRRDGKKFTASSQTVTIEFAGRVSESIEGLYQSHYTQKDGKKKVAATSQMEPTFARTMVPCFDEPSYKATWKLDIAHPTGTRALSNGAIMSSVPVDNDWMLTTFEETPLMSSYLLGLVIADFDRSQRRHDKVDFHVWAHRDALPRTVIALEAGVNFLVTYQEMFGISYPLAKLDMVAIPDFSINARENWGLITYRESTFLIDENSTFNAQIAAMQMIAHELAHQWIGNLVTMDWWDDMWLNEGLTTYVQFFAMEIFTPEVDMWAEFILTQDDALTMDATMDSHPLSYKVESNRDIILGFDPLNYAKGASVMKMLCNFLTKEAFMSAMKSYLAEFSMRTAKHDDLWDHLARAAKDAKTGDGQNVKKVADEWTEQIGFPLVSVQKMGNSYEVTQKRFYMSKGISKRYPDDKLNANWTIPITYYDGLGIKMEVMKKGHNLYLAHNHQTFPIVNYESHGYYRTCYGESGWKEILERLDKGEEPKAFPNITRARLFSDVFAVADLGTIPYSIALPFAKRLHKEKAYVPFNRLVDGLMNIYHHMDGDYRQNVVKDKLKPFFFALSENIDISRVAELDSDPKTHQKARRLTLIHSTKCTLDREWCGRELSIEYLHHVQRPCGKKGVASQCVTMRPLFREITYCNAVRHNDTVYDGLWGMFLRESVQEERDRLLIGLTCTKRKDRAENLMWKTWNLTDRDIGQQALPRLFAALNKNDVIQPTLAPYFMKNFVKIYESLKSSEKEMVKLMEECLARLTEAQMKQVLAFKEKHEYLKNHESIQKVIEANTIRHAWIAKHASEIEKYAQQFSPSNSVILRS